MSDVAGLVLLCFVAMIAPIALILYIKWDDIIARHERNKNKSNNDLEYREPSKFSKWWNTYFGKNEPVVETDVHVSEKITEIETKTTQQLLEEQRKIEKREKAQAKAKKEAEAKAKAKADEKAKIKSSKKTSKESSKKNKK